MHRINTIVYSHTHTHTHIHRRKNRINEIRRPQHEQICENLRVEYSIIFVKGSLTVMRILFCLPTEGNLNVHIC